jgi:hypothetical protein
MNDKACICRASVKYCWCTGDSENALKSIGSSTYTRWRPSAIELRDFVMRDSLADPADDREGSAR